jgi:hypothetical protein
MDQANTLVLRSKGSYKLLKISTGEIYYVIDTVVKNRLNTLMIMKMLQMRLINV